MPAAEQYSNTLTTPTSTLNGGISSGATSLVVSSAASFPAVPQFRIVIDSEIFIVTGISGTTFTVTSGAEGTTTASHSNGAAVNHIGTAAVMQNLPTAGQLLARAAGNLLF